MNTKTWQDNLDRLEMNDRSSRGCSVCLAETMGGKNMDIIYEFISDLRKKDEEELIKMLPDYRMVFPEQDTEDIIKYKLGFNDGIQKIKQLIKDYYEK